MSWKSIELAKVCEVFADGDWIESKDQSDIGIRLIQTGNVGFGRFKARDSKARYISEETFKRLRCTEIKEGDLLVSRLPDPVGRACIIPQLVDKSITAVDCTIIRTKQEILYSNYLNYYCQSPQYFEQVKKNITGATRQRISRSLLGKTLIPLAPIATQQKIVAKLDTIFAEIDTATAAAEVNAENAKLLFESFINEKLEIESTEWKENTIEEIIFDKQIGIVKNTKEQVDNGKFGYFKMNNILNNNKCQLTGLAKINANQDEVKKFRLLKNDFLFNTRNSVELVGKVCVFNGNDEDNILYNNNIMRVRFNSNVNPYFILYAFSHKNLRKSLEILKTGTTNVAAIYYKDLKNLRIKLPALEIQNKIVNEIECIDFNTNILSTISNKKKHELLLLKQSILQKAFSGELVKD